MKEHFWYATRAGIFRIVAVAGGWRIWFEDEVLMGCYLSPQHALDDLAAGATDWPTCGDPSALGLPDDIDCWHISRRYR